DQRGLRETQGGHVHVPVARERRHRCASTAGKGTGSTNAIIPAPPLPPHPHFRSSLFVLATDGCAAAWRRERVAAIQPAAEEPAQILVHDVGTLHAGWIGSAESTRGTRETGHTDFAGVSLELDPAGGRDSSASTARIRTTSNGAIH